MENKGWVFLAICILITSCSLERRASRQLRIAKKHILKAEALGGVWQTDTVFTDIAVIVPQVRIDTVFRSEVGDTVVITKDRLQVKILRLPGDSIFVEGECKADTIVKEVPIAVTRTIHAPTSSWRTAALTVAGILIVIIGAILFWLSHWSKKD